jgi:uncharacterized protein YqeY
MTPQDKIMTDPSPSLRQILTESMKDAMRAKDSVKLGTLRMVLAAVKDLDIAARTETSREGISDDEISQLLQKLIKQRREAADAFTNGGRAELADNERAEAAIIESFLPQQLDEAAMTAVIQAAIAGTGAASIKDMGKVMAALRGKYAAVLDMTAASAKVKALLAGAN